MMGPPAPQPFDPVHLRLGRDLRAIGVEPARQPDQWQRVRAGVWIPARVRAGLTPEQQHAAAVHAAALTVTSEKPLIFAGPSAAALLGLPRISAWPNQVHILGDPVADVDGTRRSRGSRPGLRRRIGTCDRVLLLHGVRMTLPARTIADLCRTESLEDALAAADQVLRRRLCSRAELAAELDAIAKHARGRRRAKLVKDLADGLSMSAGESLSRLQLFRLNIPRPELQHEFHDASGLIGYSDFYWPRAGGRGVAGEFDGRLKYAVEPGAHPARVQEVLWLEKKREDRIRKQADVARWTWTVARDANALGRELAGHGIRSQPRNTWFDLGAPPGAGRNRRTRA